MQNQLIREISCNLCYSQKTETIMTKLPYNLVKCTKCSLYYLNPQPTKKSLQSFYTKDYFQGGLAATGYSSYTLLDRDLSFEARIRLNLVKKYIHQGKLLDIGCGYGHFLKEARDDGFDVFGLDISKEAIKQLQKKYSITGKAGDVIENDLPSDVFDVITAWDVIEHIQNPRKSLQDLFKKLSKNGWLFLTTPNIKSIDAKILGKYWYGFKRIPEHLYFFSPETISQLLKIVGYEVIEIKQWGFYRNLEYCLDQIARYNKTLHYLFNQFSSIFRLENKSLFFPIIDMMVIAKKNKKA